MTEPAAFAPLRRILSNSQRTILDSASEESGIPMDQLVAFAGGAAMPYTLTDDAISKLVRNLFQGMVYDSHSGQIVPQGAAKIDVTLAGLRQKVREQVANLSGLSKQTKIEEDALAQFAFAGANLADFQVKALTERFHAGVTYADGRFVSTSAPKIIGAAALGCVVTHVPHYGDYRTQTIAQSQAEPAADQRERENDWLRGYVGDSRVEHPAATGQGVDINQALKKKQAA